LSKHSAHGVFIGEGGTFDFESFGGERKRAPQWVQRVGLEWLWRLILQPGRILRQLAVPRFIYRVWHGR
jgi:N-acetylglucosaminyldiphosphoundecaprenol N-acetyl-beta-D-mannosaminyltransferase